MEKIYLEGRRMTFSSAKLRLLHSEEILRKEVLRLGNGRTLRPTTFGIQSRYILLCITAGLLIWLAKQFQMILVTSPGGSDVLILTTIFVAAIVAASIVCVLTGVCDDPTLVIQIRNEGIMVQDRLNMRSRLISWSRIIWLEEKITYNTDETESMWILGPDRNKIIRLSRNFGLLPIYEILLKNSVETN